MNPRRLNAAAELARRTGHVFVATADAKGMPHIAAASQLEANEGETVTITEWFCPGTVENLQSNDHVAVVVWDEKADRGYQLLGRLEQMKDVGIMNGFAPGVEQMPPLPQVAKELRIHVEKVLDFRLGPHSDEQE